MVDKIGANETGPSSDKDHARLVRVACAANQPQDFWGEMRRILGTSRPWTLDNARMNIETWHLSGWAAALGTGMLIGIERERAENANERSPAGLRSFVLAALAGAVAGTLGPWALAIMLAAVALHSYAGYQQTRRHDPGLTTELALLLTVLLGALAMREAGLAAGLGVLVTLTLWAKRQLHGFARRVLSERELGHALFLAAAVLMVLPLLPNKPETWLAGLNPHALWLLAVLVMIVQGAGHVAVRWLGRLRGLALIGLVGGFVSSTATIAAMAQRAREKPDLFPVCLSAAQLSNLATVLELAAMVGFLAPPLLTLLAPAILVYGAGATFAALWALGWKIPRADAGADGLGSEPPFDARGALFFALVLSVMLLLAHQAVDWLGPRGTVIGLGLAGLADAHAASATAAQLCANDMLSPLQAVIAIVAAVSTNAVSKVFAAFAGGAGPFSWRVAATQATLVVLLWTGLLARGWL